MRIIGAILAALFAASATFLAIVVVWDPQTNASPAAVALFWTAATVSWLGAWGWWTDRRAFAAFGAWAAVLGNIWASMAALIPFGFAVVTTMRVLAGEIRAPRPHEHERHV